MIGSAGAGQFWDFTTGPSDVIYRFDYLAASNTPYGAAFVAAGARMAEQKTDESGQLDPAWLYFTQSQAQGRLAYGFYDPGFAAGIGATDAREVFSSVINDYPATIQYGSAWNTATTFTNTIIFGDPEEPEFSFTVDLLFAYSSAAVVDAYGVANSPGAISFGDCLRVNELVSYDISADFNDGEGFQHLETDFVRNYYWLRQGRGIIAQVTSQQSSGTPPPNNFATASSIVRMFQTNHPDNTGSGSGGIQGFKITVGPSGALLQWTPLASLSSYRVEYTTNLLTGSWQQVGSTTRKFPHRHGREQTRHTDALLPRGRHALNSRPTCSLFSEDLRSSLEVQTQVVLQVR
jgi:hypothetical protein